MWFCGTSADSSEKTEEMNMAALKRLNDFLPTKIDTKLAQAKIPVELHNAVRDQLTKDQNDGIHIDWNKLVEAACRVYLSERNARKAK